MAAILRSRESRLGALALAFYLCLATSGPEIQAQQCGGNSPAVAVPEFRGPTRLWPTNGFRPGLPGQQLPANRDSSQYNTLTFPYSVSGHELFWGIDIVGDRAFVMYNVGVQVWDISGANAENPQRLHFRDGVEGHWLDHPGIGEEDGYLTDIAAMQDPSDPNQVLVAISSLTPVGTTIWRFNRTTGFLSQIYQNTALEAYDVEMINFGGTIYAFFGDRVSGPFVLNVSRTNTISSPCLNAACPSGVYLGKVGSSAISRYVSVIERSGKVYLASSQGGLSSASPKPEIWELDPAAPASAVRRFLGTVSDTHSPVLFTKGSTFYMAVVESKRIRIYNVNDCLDSSGCTGLPTPTFDHTLRNQNWEKNFLTYSLSNGTPFLYHGFEGPLPAGPAYERLFDLTELGLTNVIPEMTSTGQTYTDSCNGQSGIGYWADYYANNDNGLANFTPRKAKFAGNYLYRVNYGTFDVHVRGGNIVQNPTITTTVVSPAPYWFGSAVQFSATAQSCSGPENWEWHADDTNATGLGSTSATAAINWNLCPSSVCPDKNIEVWALKDACAGDPNLTQVRSNIVVSDPRPNIEEMILAPAPQIPNTWPICTQLAFSADLGGRPPFSYTWTVRNASQQVVASSSSASWVWDTSGVVVGPEIFADGFESGNTDAWSGKSLVRDESAARELARALVEEVMGAGSAAFDVELAVTNSTAVTDTARRAITLTAIGDVAFVGASPITVTNLGGGQYRFVANTENATRWRWEIEDPANGSTVGCLFYAATKCRIIEFGADDNDVVVTWAQPNVNGNNYRVTVSAANCLDVPSVNREVTVNVTGIATGTPPAMSQFTINNALSSCQLNLGTGQMRCAPNAAIHFTLSHTGTATHYDFDWEGDGTFEQSLTVGSSVTHTYTTTGTRQPQARARNGAGTPSSPRSLPWVLNISN